MLSTFVNYTNASRDRALREHFDAKNRDLQEKIADKSNRLQERMGNLKLEQQKAPAVKIVFSPPVIDERRERSCFGGNQCSHASPDDGVSE